MLYIIPIDSYTIKFHDNNGHSQLYGNTMEARVDSVGRIWISDRYLDINMLNSCLVSEISFWDGSAYQVYETAQEFVVAFNQLWALLNPPAGYEVLRDSTGAIIRDSTGAIIYILKA